MQENVARVLLGKEEAIELAVITLVAGGHLLIEDHPGVGKTLLARAIARSLNLPFQRLQCTADLLPADVLGAQVYHPGSGEITFRPGPVFTSVLVADELNRTPPRTQSALLECMQERQVTIDRVTHPLPRPFFVVATQNPGAFAGTYPLPESQLDRFLMRIRLGHPEPETELRIVQREDGHQVLAGLEPVANGDELLAAQADVAHVRMSDELAAHVVAIVHRTRTHPDVRLGASTRGGQALHRAARARALVRGRDYVVPDDVQALCAPVLSHRLVARGGDGGAEALLADILAQLPAPD